MSKTMPLDLYQAIIKVAKNHIKDHYPGHILLVEKFRENSIFTFFKLYRAHIVQNEDCIAIVSKKALIESYGTSLRVYSVNKRKCLIDQLNLLGMRAH